MHSAIVYKTKNTLYTIMYMQILDGKLVASKIKENIKKEVDSLKDDNKRLPLLATILVGENPASLTYVSSKHKNAEKLGFLTKDYKLSAECDENEIIEIIEKLNNDKTVDAILLQLPLPTGFDTSKILAKIKDDKDADGISYTNIAKLALSEKGVVPCTPSGILQLLKYYNIPLSGKTVAVIGRSRIVGRPLGLLLNTKEVNASVISLNSHSEKLKELSKQADVLISAVGIPNFIDSSFIKKGAVVVDVGINRIKDETSLKGYRIQGDVNFDEVAPITSYITPVPGGVGPLTIACLMQNTLFLYNKHEEINESTY